MSEKINSADDLKKKLAPLDKLMGYKTEFKKTFGSRDKNIISAYRVMTNHLLALASEKTVKVSTKDRNCVRGASRIVTAILTRDSISRYLRDFCTDYLPLMNNWNRQLGNDSTVRAMIGASYRILEDMMTMKDTSDIMKDATKRLRELLRYKPAAFELSRHYLQSLQEDIEKKEVEG